MKKTVGKEKLIKPSFERIDDRGILKEIINDPDKSWTAINWGSVKKDSVMGNHYHKNTTVLLFMIKGKLKVHIPNPHRGDISTGLVAEILRQAGISKKEWEDA